MGLHINRLELGLIVGFIFKRFSKRICVAKPDPWILALEELLRNWNSQLSNRPTRITIGSKWDHFKFDSVRLYGPGLETKAKSRMGQNKACSAPNSSSLMPITAHLGVDPAQFGPEPVFSNQTYTESVLGRFPKEQALQPPNEIFLASNQHTKEIKFQLRKWLMPN